VGTTEADLKLKASSGASKTIKYYTADYEWYNDLHDYSVNLDYSEEAVTSMKLTFSEPGFYSFDSIGIVCQPMDNYADQIASLKSSALENVEIGTNTVSGTIALDQPKFLCFSIPYSKGWTAYVDGEEATLYQANVKNMALSLDEGTHDIVLTYHTPYLKLGVLVSVGGFVIFIVIGCFEIRKRKKREPGTHKEVISYLFWGVMTTLVSWISYSIFVTLMQSVSIANVLSWICAVLFAFVTNKLWVFQSKEWAFRIMIPEFLKFVTARLATGVMEIVGVPLLVYLGLDQKIAGIEGMAAKVLVSIVVIILNYVLSKLLVFRNKQEPERKENG
jgi:putative flippase GtrA